MRTSIVALLSVFGPAVVHSAPTRDDGFIGFNHGSGVEAEALEVATASASASAYSASSTASSHASGGDSYVVLVNASHPYPPDVEEVLQRIELSSNHSDVHHIFNNSAFKGFSASMQSHCVDKLLNMSDISHVEKSVSMSSFDTWTRAESPWGLQRVSSTSSISGDVKNLDYTYSFDDSKLGKGVDIYVVDTGVNVDHIAFGGRASNGWTAYPTGGPNNGGWTGSGGNFTDGAGHGTHVSGTAAGSVLGIASGANIIAVRVLDDNGGGATNVTIAGIDWVVNQHEFRKTQPDFVGSILSMSFGTSEVVKTLTDAIAAATAAGIHASVAAGNDGEDACNYSPSNGGGGNSSIVSVGSIGSSNTISSFSNTGACTDIYAPGENVLSCWIGGDNVVQYLDGTSMATPHVTGVMAYMMVQDSSLAEDPAAMKDYLTRSALKNMVTGSVASGGAKLLLNNGVTSTVSKRAARPQQKKARGKIVVPSDVNTKPPKWTVSENTDRIAWW